MKRHESLAILSRQHHGALILSQLLKQGAPEYRGLPTDIPGKITYASQFFAEELLPHFAAEEKVFATLKNGDPRLEEAIREIEEEHQLLKNLFTGIPGSTEPEPYLDALGKTLEQHIRKEERHVFPLIEEIAGEEKLQEIMELLTH